LPSGVPAGQSGPRLTAFVALLMASFRQSKRRVSLFLETLLGAPCSPGLVVKLQKLATAALRPCYEELVRSLPAQPVVNADETPTRERNGKAWLWTVVAATFSVFAVRLTKAAVVIRELLGEKFAGVVISDRAKMYLWVERLQWCWSHVKRDFEAMATLRGKAGAVGRKLCELTYDLFHQWHRAQAGDLQAAGLRRHLNRLYGQVYLTLEAGTFCRHAATAATCQGLLERYDSLWIFRETPGVAPTNNAAERALRHGVIWKRLSFGTQSASGSRFVETLLSVLETCRQQKRPTFAFLSHALTQHFAHQPAPSLLAGP
jgi:transposase